jgi:hypothetical protein
MEAWRDAVVGPAVVRYTCWADNPVCNLQNQEVLAITPVRMMTGSA